MPSAYALPASNGFYESLNADVLHLPYPLHFVASTLPTVFSVYDLQHRHFPQFFSTDALAWREQFFPAAFARAHTVVSDSDWVRNDLMRQYGLSLAKTATARLGPPTVAYQAVDQETCAAVQCRFALPERFAFYPALTYEHKNHVRLLDAIALLRDRDNVCLNLVCTGLQQHYWPHVKARIDDLQLNDQVHFLGYVSAEELRAIYRLAQFLVFPSLFEGAGMPVLEAFHEGLPVTCSDIPALREYAGAAAHFFGPTAVQSIAAALRRLWEDAALRANLKLCGAERIRLFTWEHTARVYRAIYRRAAGVPIEADDRALLSDTRLCQTL
jgi:glycosyltransferase involved in cell wall biosynthesis